MSTQVGFETANGQKFVPGIQGFSGGAPSMAVDPNAVSPNAIRWLFNPFAYVNINDRPVSGHQQLQAGKFIPITSQSQFVALPNQPALSPGSLTHVGDDMSRQNVGVATAQVPPPGYRTEIRSAFAIASEIEDAYSDKGVRILPSLTKFEDAEAVSAIYQTLVEPGLKYTPDPYQPNFPVPNLVMLESHLMGEATREAAKFGTNLTINPSLVVSDILIAVRVALQTCRNVTREAKRVVANRTIGYVHAFDAYQSRCFIALGEDVPSDIPADARFSQTPAQAVAAVSQRMSDAEIELELRKVAAQEEANRLKALELEKSTVLSTESVVPVEETPVSGDSESPSPRTKNKEKTNEKN